MSLDKLKRVMWRIQELNCQPASEGRVHTFLIQKAIMEECGTDERTIKWNFKQLRRLGWIKGTWQNRHSWLIKVPDD